MPDSVWRSVVAIDRKYAREVRAAVLALVPIVLSTPAAGAGGAAGKAAFLDRGALRVVDLSTGSSRVVARHVSGAVGLSGDGKLVSVGGRVVGGPTLGKGGLGWAPTGETTAYQTPSGAVFTWSPATGRRLVVAASWGATSFAWGRDGALALGRSICNVPCGVPLHQEVWIRRGGSLRRAARPPRGVQLPPPAAVVPAGRRERRVPAPAPGRLRALRAHRERRPRHRRAPPRRQAHRVRPGRPGDELLRPLRLAGRRLGVIVPPERWCSRASTI